MCINCVCSVSKCVCVYISVLGGGIVNVVLINPREWQKWGLNGDSETQKNMNISTITQYFLFGKIPTISGATAFRIYKVFKISLIIGIRNILSL